MIRNLRRTGDSHSSTNEWFSVKDLAVAVAKNATSLLIENTDILLYDECMKMI